MAEARSERRAKRILVLDNLEYLEDVIVRLIKETEQNLAPARGNEKEFLRIIGEHPHLYLRDESDQRCYMHSPRLLCATFEAGENAWENFGACGMLKIVFDINSEKFILPDLSEKGDGPRPSDKEEKHLYNVSVHFIYRQNTPFKDHGRAGVHSTAHSQYGTIYGFISELHGDWVKFQSADYRKINATLPPLQSLRVMHNREGWGYGGARRRIPDELPVEFSLLVNHLQHGLKDKLDYWGFKFRAADLGKTEFRSLVNHLGFGREESPNYTFESLPKEI